MVVAEENMVLYERAMLKAIGVDSSILRSEVEANNFELWPTIANFMGREAFGKHSIENPNAYS